MIFVYLFICIITFNIALLFLHFKSEAHFYLNYVLKCIQNVYFPGILIRACSFVVIKNQNHMIIYGV